VPTSKEEDPEPSSSRKRSEGKLSTGGKRPQRGLPPLKKRRKPRKINKVAREVAIRGPQNPQKKLAKKMVEDLERERKTTRGGKDRDHPLLPLRVRACF